MRYLGGKSRIAKQLTDFLKSVRQPNQVFVDGMVGGCSITRHMDGVRIANDTCPYLITFYKRLQNGWLPPEHISEERYKELKKLSQECIGNYDLTAEVAFAMYFCSFGGKWAGGYARDKKSDRDFSKEAFNDSLNLIRGQYNDSKKLQPSIKDVNFSCTDYKDLLDNLNLTNRRDLIYFDIPYEQTTGYKYKFNHKEFWAIIRRVSNFHDIYVSSYVAPEDFECVWSLERKTNLNTKEGKSSRIEKIFNHRG